MNSTMAQTTMQHNRRAFFVCRIIQAVTQLSLICLIGLAGCMPYIMPELAAAAGESLPASPPASPPVALFTTIPVRTEYDPGEAFDLASAVEVYKLANKENFQRRLNPAGDFDVTLLKDGAVSAIGAVLGQPFVFKEPGAWTATVTERVGKKFIVSYPLTVRDPNAAKPESSQAADFAPELKVVQIRQNYTAGDKILVENDVAVYKTDADGSSLKLAYADPASGEGYTLSASGASLSKPIDPVADGFPAAGAYTITVIDNAAAARAAAVTFSTSALSAYTALVQVVPYRTEYAPGDPIETRTDLAVYKRDLVTGEMQLADWRKVAVSPSSMTNASQEIVEVTIDGYPDAFGRYFVRKSGASSSSGSFGPMIQVVPLRMTYSKGDTISKSEMAVYKQNITNGAMEKVGETGYTLVEPAGTFISEGLQQVTVRVNNYPTAGDHTHTFSYKAQVSAGITPEVLAFPFKTSYSAGATINLGTDLAVYKRNIATGAMEKLDGSQPAPPFTLNLSGPLSASSNAQAVTVTVSNYPSAGQSKQSSYNIWVGAAPDPLTPFLVAIPIRTAYTVGDTVTAANEVVVYKMRSSGIMERLQPPNPPQTAGEFDLVIGSVNPAQTPFTSAGPKTITVRDTSAGNNAASVTYSVQVSAATVYSPVIRVIPIKTSYKSGTAVEKYTDLAVFKRDLKTGLQMLVDPGDFTVSPSTPLTVPVAGNTQVITVTVPNYGSTAGTSGTYSVYVDAQPASTVPYLQVVPVKTTYIKGQSVIAGHIVVYKHAAGGAVTANYTNISISPSAALTTPGAVEVTVTDMASPAATAAKYTIWVEAAGSFSPLVQITPYRTAYTVGDVPAKNEMAVYVRDTATGQMTAVPADGFTIIAPSAAFSAAGTATVTVRANNYPVAGQNTTASYPVQVSASITPMVQVVPFRTSYGLGDTIDWDNDLAIYVRDMATGNTVLLAPGKFTVVPAPAFIREGAFIATGMAQVVVTALNYPSAGVNTTSRYNVWISSTAQTFVPSMLVIKYKSAYGVDETIDPAADIEVYKSTSAGITRLPYSSSSPGFTLDTAGSGSGIARFSTEGIKTITVKDSASGSGKAADSAYTVTVTSSVYGPNTMTALYVDNTTGTLTRDSAGEWRPSTPTYKVIHSVTAIDPVDGTSRVHLIGHRDNLSFQLNLDGRGRVLFHPAITDGPYTGYIPVETVAELQKINTDAGTLAGKYVVVQPVDLLGGSNTLASLRHNWTPIGSYSTPFTGSFDGNDRWLDNISSVGGSEFGIGGTDFVGLFGKVGGVASRTPVVKRINLTGTVRGVEGVGGIAAVVDRGATVVNCRNQAAVYGVVSVGGIAGFVENGATVSECVNAGTVETVTSTSQKGRDIGGVAGIVNVGGKVISCGNIGAVTSTDSDGTGGVAGSVYPSATLESCYNTGNITGSDDTGGVAGIVYGTVTACYNKSEVSGLNGVGGVAGVVRGSGKLVACYNKVFDVETRGMVGYVDGSTDIGGIVGRRLNSAQLIACYTSITPSPGTGRGVVAGFCDGYGTGVDLRAFYKHCFWLNVNNSVAAIGNTGFLPTGTDDRMQGFFGGVINASQGNFYLIWPFPNLDTRDYSTNPTVEWGTGNGGTGMWWRSGSTIGVDHQSKMEKLPKLWFE
jgi:hypothetical protein